jgi:hypothetical protein
MLPRFLIVLPVALGALCCPFRCLHEQALSAEYFLANHESSDSDYLNADQGDVKPISPPREEDESGCICRGAFFIDAPAIVPLDLAKWCPLLESRIELPSLGALDAPGDFLAEGGICWRPPITGRALRALHSTFLL